MPFCFEEKDVMSEVNGVKSALIVPCRFCPAASAAVKNDKPYFEFFKRFLKTESYEQQLSTLQANLEKEGIKSGLFKSNILHQFVLCMWTGRRRRKLLREAARYDVAVVVGCEAATETVTKALESTECRVIQGMKTEGIMNVVPKFRLPGELSLKCESVTRVLH